MFPKQTQDKAVDASNVVPFKRVLFMNGPVQLTLVKPNDTEIGA